MAVPVEVLELARTLSRAFLGRTGGGDTGDRSPPSLESDSPPGKTP
jgi:hypothetical protein